MKSFLGVAMFAVLSGFVLPGAPANAAAERDLRGAGPATTIFAGSGVGYRVEIRRRAGKVVRFRMTASESCSGQPVRNRRYSFNRKLSISSQGRFAGSVPAYGEESLKGGFRGRFAFGVYTNWNHADDHFGFPDCEITASKQRSSIRFRAKRIRVVRP